jgi:hypothetical protein
MYKKIVIALLSSVGYFLIMFFWDRGFSMESIKSESPLKIILFLIISLFFGIGTILGFKFKK